jgi:hypothetical protein
MEEVAALGEGFSLGFSLLRISPSQRGGVSLLHFQNVAMCKGVGAFFEFPLISKKSLIPQNVDFKMLPVSTFFLNRSFPLGIKKLMSWRWCNALANSIACRNAKNLGCYTSQSFRRLNQKLTVKYRRTNFRHCVTCRQFVSAAGRLSVDVDSFSLFSGMVLLGGRLEGHDIKGSVARLFLRARRFDDNDDLGDFE